MITSNHPDVNAKDAIALIRSRRIGQGQLQSKNYTHIQLRP